MTMRSLFIPALTCLILASTAAQTQENGDIGDPDPTVIPYKGGKETPSAKPERGTFPLPPVLGERHIWQELHGYEKGNAVHEHGRLFCERLAREITAQMTSGRRIDRIIVTGFADGIINYGLRRDIGAVPAKCLAGVSIPVDDHELALLRGCTILEQISLAIGKPNAGGISWKGEEYDVPDGGNEGDSYRKVRVDVYLRRAL